MPPRGGFSSGQSNPFPQSLARFPWVVLRTPDSIESTGDNVTRWRDDSGNGYHALPAVSTCTVDHSLTTPGVRFGASGATALDSPISVADNACTIFMLERTIDPSLSGRAVKLELSDTGTFERSLVVSIAYGSVVGRSAQVDTANAQYLPDAATQTALAVRHYDFTSTNRVIYENGRIGGTSAASTVTVTPVRTAGICRLGCYLDGTAPFSGVMYFVGIIAGTLTDMEKAAITQELLSWASIASPVAYPFQRPSDVTITPVWDVPSTLDTITNRPVTFFRDNLYYDDGSDPALVATTSLSGLTASLGDRFVVTPPSAATSTITFRKRSNTKVCTMTARALPSGPIKLLLFGDSTASRGQALLEILKQVLGGNITCLGLVAGTNGYSQPTEGHPSQKCSYFDSAGSPFWMGGAGYDLAGYTTAIGDTPTHVICFCGQNDVSGQTVGALQSAITAGQTRLANVFAAMDSEWNIPIGVANNWPLCADASLFTSWAAQRAAHFNVSEWARRAGEMVGGNVSLLDTYTSIDPLRGYERDGIHPNALGYTQAAERVLGWLAAH